MSAYSMRASIPRSGLITMIFRICPPLISKIFSVPTTVKTVALAGVGWHFSPRHALELEYFTLNRNNLLTDTYDPPVQFDDIFIENGQISTDYDTTITRLTYGYSIIRNERSDLQLMAGIHIAKLDIAVQFSGAVCLPTTTPSVPPGCPVATSSDDRRKVSAPLPHLGIAYTYSFTPTIAMNLAAKGFAVEIDDIDGNIIEIDADVAWQPWRNVGFGVGARYFNTDVKSSGEDLNGTIEFEYFGPMIYVQATF